MNNNNIPNIQLSNKAKQGGVRLINELMVDIFGAWIPGMLLFFSLFLCIVCPALLFVEHEKATFIIRFIDSLSSMSFIILIVIMILAYSIGHIFYRDDIKKPDRKDFIKRRKQVIKDIKKEYTKIQNDKIDNKKKRLINILRKDIDYTFDSFSCSYAKIFIYQKDTLYRNLYDSYKELCKDKDNKALYNFYSKNDKIKIPNIIMTLLFPEYCQTNDFKEYNTGPNIVTKILKEYEKIIKRNINVDDNDIISILICICILKMQVETACTTTNRCEFPYQSYYKYAMRRDLCELLPYIDWHSPNSRSKNKLNKYKIKIQLFAHEKYSLINKNESHIRMASSSWHISKFMLITSIVSMCIIPIVTVLLDCAEPLKIALSLESFPIINLILSIFMMYKIKKFIHYQRLREIFYTLSIYKELDSAGYFIDTKN